LELKYLELDFGGIFDVEHIFFYKMEVCDSYEFKTNIYRRTKFV